MSKSKKGIHQPHDIVFKQTFGRKDVMLDFLERRIPAEIFAKIDKEKLHLTNKSLLVSCKFFSVEGYFHFCICHAKKFQEKIEMLRMGSLF